MSVMKPCFVENDLRFGQVEVDRAAPVAARVQDLEQLAHQLEHRHQLAILRDRLRILLRQDRVDRGVGHARVAANHAVVHLVAQHVAARRHFHQAGLHQPIDIGFETAQPGGEVAREHVHGALGEIHRGAALEGLLVERTALTHVVRDVGDMHAEPVVAVLQSLDRDRVVEIARVLAVDGDDLAVAKIGAAGDVLVADRGADALGLGDRLGAVLVRDAVLAKNDLGVDARVVDVAEHFDDSARRSARRRRPARHFDGHHLPRFGIPGLGARDLDVGGQTLVERRDEAETGSIDLIAADHRRCGTLEHLDDAAFRAAVLAVALDARDHAVAVHRLLHGVLGHVNVTRQPLDGLFGRDEAETGWMAIQLADHQIHAIRQAVAIALDLNQRAVADEAAQVALEARPFVAGNLEDAQDLARGGGMRHLLPQEPK